MRSPRSNQNKLLKEIGLYFSDVQKLVQICLNLLRLSKNWSKVVEIGSKICLNLFKLVFFFRLMSLTDKSVLDTTSDMSIRIKCDKENHVLSITDTGVGMTKQDLITNLGK